MACLTRKKNKPGRWCIDFYDQHGKRRLKVLKAGTTKKQAKKVLRDIERQLDRGVFIPAKNVPLFSEVARDWLDYKKPNVRESTWNAYKAHVEYHFDDIDGLRINTITIAMVEKFIAKRQGEDMNLSTLRRILVTFNQVMAYAVRHRYIDHNPVRDAERPKGQGGEEKSDIRVLQPEEINSFLDATGEKKYRTLFMLAVMSGARQGELLGFKWTDLDWFNQQIHVQRTYHKGNWYNPKSKASNRKIDLGPTMMAELKKWKLACGPSALDLMFPNGAGKPMNHANMLRRHFYPALEAGGLPAIRFHDLRHTYASLKLEQGASIKYIQNQLGHASPTVTLNIYSHLMRSTNPESAQGLEELVFGKNGDQMETSQKKEATGGAVTS